MSQLRTNREAASLLGRAIVAVDMRPFDGGDNGHSRRCTDPVITLDDGTRLSFLTQETEHGAGYGIAMFRQRVKK